MVIYESDASVLVPETKVLVHRASGASALRENTVEAATHTIGYLDGIEVDVVISKDGGLWLSHEAKVHDLDKYFINVADEEIGSVLDSAGDRYYDSLEEVLAFMADQPSEKHISLDVKKPFSLINVTTYKNAALKIMDLVEKYDLGNRVMVESSVVGFLSQFNPDGEFEQDSINTYYMCYGDFDRGLAVSFQNDLSGISFHYGRSDEMTAEKVELAHSLGRKVLIYTINGDNIPETKALEVDVIQTDHLDFYGLYIE